MRHFLFTLVMFILICGTPLSSFAQSDLTEPQIAAIIELLHSFGVDSVTTSLVGKGLRAHKNAATPDRKNTATSTAPSVEAATTTATGTEQESVDAPPPVIGSSGGGGGSAPPAPIVVQPANTPPTLSLEGSDTYEIAVGDAWIDPGASATDPEDGNLTAEIAISGMVDLYTAGTYLLSYSVSDTEGLSANVERTIVVKAPVLIPESAQEPDYTLAPAGEAAVFSISSSEPDVMFIEARIDPLHVYVGDTQTLTVKIASTEPIASVDATTILDNETLVLPLKKTSEDASGEIWSTSWTVFDTHVKTYRTTFTAANSAGVLNSITLAWSDPCSGLVQGKNSSLSANCTVSAVDGLDSGSFTIPSGKTLTLNSGAQWVWNPGKTITVHGTIAINGTASMKKGYLFYSGATNDSANTSSKVFGSSSTKSNHVRVATHFSFASGNITGAELNTYYYSGTKTIGGIANGTTVSLSGSSSVKQMSINGGSWVTSGTINNGQTLRLRQRSSGSSLTQTTVKATIAGNSSTFSVTTKFNNPGDICDPICP